MTTTNLTLYGNSARQIKPAVVNLFQNNNLVDRLEFTMENYNQDNVDLSTMDAYAICYGSEFPQGLDEVKLESEVTSDGLLRVYWDLTVMTLNAAQTITYQIVFKNNEGAVWTSYKAILFCNESLTADEEIVAQYPTILKQMEGRVEAKSDEIIENINNMAGNFDASVVYVPYGETIPVEERLANRLYYLYTDEGHTKGRFEDSNGTILNLDPTGFSTHVGQTIFSLLPINNAGVHLLDGTKLSGDGAYGGFVEYISELYDKAAYCFCSEDEWQASVTKYGVCGKFVYNSEENSVRLPKVTGFVEGTVDATALGDLVEAGLPNITGTFYSMSQIVDGAFSVIDGTGSYTGTTNTYYRKSFDASRSNSTYGNSDTVQPQAIKGYYYIVVATSTTTEVNITNEIELNNPFSLFDVKWSDHNLENISWLKSNGSYHSGAVYPSAYNELLSEYGSPDAVEDGVTSEWNQPATTDVSTPDGGGYIVCSASSESGDNLAWWALDSYMLGTDSWISATGVTSGWWQVKFPYKLKIKGLTFYSPHSSTYGSKDCRFYTSSDMTTPIGDDFVGKSSGFTATTVTGIPEEGMVTDTLYLNITSSHGTGIGMGHLDIEAERIDLSFKRTPKGYKITTSEFEFGVNNMYDTDGVAWYYVIDPANGKFKLPRTKFGFEGVRSAVGDAIQAGLPNITGTVAIQPDDGHKGTTGAFYVTDTKGSSTNAQSGTANRLTGLDASRSNLIYGNSDTVQEPATQMNLYFYVGETVQNANLINAGRIEEKVASIIPDNSSLIASYGMPSRKYIDLTLGASLTVYTAPANGWVYVKGNTTNIGFIGVGTIEGDTYVSGSDSWITYNDSMGELNHGDSVSVLTPMAVGQKFFVGYGAVNITHFRFIYAEGEV